MFLIKNHPIPEYPIEHYLEEYKRVDGTPVTENEAREIKSACESKKAIEFFEWLDKNNYSSKSIKRIMDEISSVQKSIDEVFSYPQLSPFPELVRLQKDPAVEIAQRNMQYTIELQETKLRMEQKNREDLAKMIADNIVSAQVKNSLPWDNNPVIKEMIEDKMLLVAPDGKHLRFSLALNSDTINNYPITSKYLIDLGYILSIDGRPLTFQNISTHLSRH